MYGKIYVLLFHLGIVFPYLGWLGYRLSHLDEEKGFNVDSKIVGGVVLFGVIYQLLLLWNYSKILLNPGY